MQIFIVNILFCFVWFFFSQGQILQLICLFKSQSFAGLKTMWWRKCTENRRNEGTRQGSVLIFLRMILMFLIQHPCLVDSSLHELFYRWKGTFWHLLWIVFLLFPLMLTELVIWNHLETVSFVVIKHSISQCKHFNVLLLFLRYLFPSFWVSRKWLLKSLQSPFSPGQYCCEIFILSTQTLRHSFLWNIWKHKNAVMENCSR